MKRTIFYFLAMAVLAVSTFANSANAQIAVHSAVFPAATVPGGTIVFHAGLVNPDNTAAPVTATITVTNPGQCVSEKVSGGALAVKLSPRETRLVTLTSSIPAAACAGTYTVTVTVKNSSGGTIATHKTTFTVDPAR